MILIKMLPITGLVVLTAGCASTEPYSAIPVPRSLGKEYTANAVGTKPAGTLVVPVEMTIADALALAVQGNPGLAAYSQEVRVAEARVLQAGILPNPELEVELDEYDRGGEGFGSAETAVFLGQVFELGNKRQWRTRIAQAEGELAGWDFESKRLDVFTETAKRFAAVLAAQERLEIASLAVDLAEQTSQAVAERVKAGKEPPVQAAKSKAEKEMASLDKEAALNNLDAARINLAIMWGSEKPGFEHVQGNLDHVIGTVPALEKLRTKLDFNPDLARWDAELRLRSATLSSEKAARIPDLRGSLGYLQFEEDGTDALAFGIGLPLPLFDRNHGNIRAARQRISKAEQERLDAELELVSKLVTSHANLKISQQRAITLRDKVVPAMEQAFEVAHEGYQLGKFGFLEMLEAQRGLCEANAALVGALRDYQIALIDIQRLTGTHIEALMN